MRYRTFGKLDWKPSALGFGAMRLPILNDDVAQIDEAQATRMVHTAIDQGVNYVDTAFPYHAENSERFLGRVLQDGYRERVMLASKLPCWLVESEEDFDRFLNTQLERLQTDHLDFYLLHGLGRDRWDSMKKFNVLDWAKGAIADGRIHHLGFSFHDKLEVFQEIIDATDLWTMCQIQYNFMDTDYQAGTAGLKYAAEKGLAVVIMEPIRGGGLAKSVPPSIQAIWDQAAVKRTPADWALQWVWNQPEVSLVLSGMSLVEHVEQNLESANRSGVGSLTAEELALYAQVREEYEKLCPVPCTSCKYCLPCPSGVNIPRVFELYNDMIMYGDEERARMVYERWVSEDERASMCIECGECLDKCPQHIEIPEWLAKAHAALCKPEDSSEA